MENWHTFSDQNLSIELHYPDPTPLGFSVKIVERKADTSYRKHLVSNGSDEVYFEIGQYRNLSTKQAIDAFLKDVTERIARIETSEVDQIEFSGSPVFRFSILWPGKERMILFIEKEGLLYRVIYDPASPINKLILDSFKFL